MAIMPFHAGREGGLYSSNRVDDLYNAASQSTRQIILQVWTYSGSALQNKIEHLHTHIAYYVPLALATIIVLLERHSSIMRVTLRWANAYSIGRDW
jgi:hypothetical protein